MTKCLSQSLHTGCAASNIQGQTLNAAFGFSFDNQYRSMSDKVRDKRRAELQNLKLVIVDEVSMVKADMLYMLDLRLQEITQKDIPFGGISVIAFGDLMQLRPIMGRFIFEAPINEADFGQAHLLDPRWRMFSSLILEKNHRQGSDKTYADLLNKIRVGAHSMEELEPLFDRVRPLGHKDLEQAELWISGKRKECANLNEKFMAKLEGPEVAVLKAVHHHATDKNYKPKIDKKDNVVGNTGFLDCIPIKLGARVMLIHNVDTIDGMTNGQLGKVVDVIKTTSGQVDKVVMKPQDGSIGRLNQQKFPALAMKYPDCIFVERVTLTYSLRKKSGDVGSSATVFQFPLKLAFCITSHKIQGQSILHPTKVAMDIDSCFDEAQARVVTNSSNNLVFE